MESPVASNLEGVKCVQEGYERRNYKHNSVYMWENNGWGQNTWLSTNTNKRHI